MKVYDKIKPIFQGVDTLKTSHIITDSRIYSYYSLLLDLLEDEKQKAIENNYDYSSSFSVFDLGDFGRFRIYSKGQGSYRYIVANDDFTLSFSRTKFGANDFETPQFTVEYRSKFLASIGHIRAYGSVMKMLRKLIISDLYQGENNDPLITDEEFLKTRIQRIDLALDITGADYVLSDKYRFQARFKRTNFIEFHEYVQYNNLTGFSFGKGEFMFRIYNKRLEVDTKPEKMFITRNWEFNGYDSINKPSVWRHEIQFRRAYIKQFIPKGTLDEVKFIFTKLGNLWSFGISKIHHVSLNDTEVLKIMNGEYGSEALKKVFQRAKKDPFRYDFWFNVEKWNGSLYTVPYKYQKENKPSTKVAQNFLKAFITTAYKAHNGDLRGVLRTMEDTQDYIMLKDGMTFEEYAKNKLLTSYIDNHRFITEYGLISTVDYLESATSLHDELYDFISHLGNREFNSSSDYLKEKIA